MTVKVGFFQMKDKTDYKKALKRNLNESVKPFVWMLQSYKAGSCAK